MLKKPEFHLPNALFYGLFLLIILSAAFRGYGLPGSSELSEEKRGAEITNPAKAWWEDENKRELTKFFNDTFSFRSALITLHHLVHLKIFRESPLTDHVVAGKNNWLYFAGEGTIFSYLNLKLFTEGELELISSKLGRYAEMVENYGGKLYLLIIPNTGTVYPENLPDWLENLPGGEISKLDQLRSYLANNGNINLIDLKTPLIDAKKYFRLYHKTDSHWNSLGAYIVYREIMKVICPDCPQAPGLNSPNPVYEMRKTAGGDLAEILNIKLFITEENPVVFFDKPVQANPGRAQDFLNTEYVYRNPGKKSAIVVFRDSAFSSVIPFMSGDFETAVFLKKNFDPEVIKKIKPDTVILSMVERHIDELLR
jgi:hypothetical protein